MGARLSCPIRSLVIAPLSNRRPRRYVHPGVTNIFILMVKHSKEAQEYVEEAMHEMKEGKLKSSNGQPVTNPKQAIAIGLNEAREHGAKVPEPENHKEDKDS